MQDVMGIKIVKVLSGDHINPVIPELVDFRESFKHGDLVSRKIREVFPDYFTHYLLPVFAKILKRRDFALKSCALTVPMGSFISEAISS